MRAKLITGIVALIVLVCVVIGVVTEVFLSNYLLKQLDTNLMAASLRGPDQRAGDPTNPLQTQGSAIASSRGTAADTDFFGRGGTVGTIRAAVVGGKVTNCFESVDQSATTTGTSSSTAADAEAPASGAAGRPTGGQGPGQLNTVTRQLSVADCAALASVLPNGNAITLKLPIGSYRVRAADLTINGSSFVVVTGLPTADKDDIQSRLVWILAIVSAIALAVGGLVVFLIVRRSVRPLERVAATARKVATLPLDKGEVDLGVRVPERDTDIRTEIGQVGSAINQMLTHVSNALESRQASETRVRQFVADASHELRTPLAAIRGYSELARRGQYDQEAVAHALRRVESESARMTTLVDDLLLLARLDSGRPLATEEVDLTMLAVDRVSDARAAGPDHRWQLDLPDEPVTIVGDGARLHQVLGNLLTNARNHTPPGTLVTTGLRIKRGGVELTVTDNGPGIPLELQSEVFGRFVRGDSSRSRAAGSTGLGLAIVAAVIGAHNGTVEVESRPGYTQIRVWLPDAHLESSDYPIAEIAPSESKS